MSEAAPLTLLYDGDCPVCKNFVRHMRLKQDIGDLRLLDARQPSDERSRVEVMGLDLNKGFVLFVGEEVYYADRAMQTLALMSSRSGLFNRLTYHIFRHVGLSRVLYPMLATGRLILLRLLGRGLIE